MKTMSTLLVWASVVFVSPATAIQTQSGDISQHHSTGDVAAATDEVGDFMARARAAGLRYQDRRNAIFDGFRRIGPDFPSMGEHWVHPRRTVEGELNVDHPQALSYVVIRGVPTLTGVIYATPLTEGQPLPDFPVGVHAWHDHSGAIEEESVILRHTIEDHARTPGVRLAMLHVWIEPKNPSGVFESDNWALPFARLGLETPKRFDRSAAKALSLVTGGDEFYLLLFRVLGVPEAAEVGVVQELIRGARAEVEAWLGERPARPQLTASELILLSDVWTRLWTSVGEGVSTGTRHRLDPLLLP